MNGTKSLIGHCLGAAGGMEAIATIKAIQTGWVHPTLNQVCSTRGCGFTQKTAIAIRLLTVIFVCLKWRLPVISSSSLSL